MSKDIRIITKKRTLIVQRPQSITAVGDMTKAVYDTNNDSIVDNSDNSLKLGGVEANQFLKSTDHIDCGTF